MDPMTMQNTRLVFNLGNLTRDTGFIHTNMIHPKFNLGMI